MTGMPWLNRDAIIAIPAPRYSPELDADGKPIYSFSSGVAAAQNEKHPDLLAALRARKAARATAAAATTISAASPKKKKTVGPNSSNPRPVFFPGCMPGSVPGRVLWRRCLDHFAARRAELKTGKKGRGGSGSGRGRPPKHIREQNREKDEVLAEKQCTFVAKNCSEVNKFGEIKNKEEEEEERKMREMEEASVARFQRFW
ncbi:hypothetical protein QBC32DRAFT_364269 [Pseudoneurospora amorphoporcata]|uniref:Uncharacterized protein n=1 Tax=Pseudoneurospora amorphoporcata TaxID=241081 RepID=A0AAN6SDQ0_9PEZI|nr:hypothetical protein QBC32DRAFT_364269 [Pseudoneurospora amorphoporcata]